MRTESPTPRQTQNHLRQLLSQHRLRPRHTLGQCFLVDLNLLDILVAHAELTEDDFVLEVGAGTGSLTQRVAARARVVLGVEIDPSLCSIAEQSVRHCSNVRLFRADILRSKNELNPAVAREIRALAATPGVVRRKVVANLPYSVATPLISLLLCSEFDWCSMVLTVQKELADRLAAEPGTKDYGSISVLAQASSEVRLLRELPPSAFWPRPQVHSAFVALRPRPDRHERVKDLGWLNRFTRALLIHRRKTLRVALSGALPELPKRELDEFLRSRSMDPQTRAESLPVERFVDLADSLPDTWRNGWGHNSS